MYIVVNKPADRPPEELETKLLIKDMRSRWSVEQGAGGHILLWWNFICLMFDYYQQTLPQREKRMWPVQSTDRELHAMQFAQLHGEFGRLAVVFTNQWYEYARVNLFTFDNYEVTRARLRPSCTGCGVVGAWSRSINENGRLEHLFTCPADCNNFLSDVKRHIQSSARMDQQKLAELWTLTTGLNGTGDRAAVDLARPWMVSRPTQGAIRLARQHPTEGLIPI